MIKFGDMGMENITLKTRQASRILQMDKGNRVKQTKIEVRGTRGKGRRRMDNIRRDMNKCGLEEEKVEGILAGQTKRKD